MSEHQRTTFTPDEIEFRRLTKLTFKTNRSAKNPLRRNRNETKEDLYLQTALNGENALAHALEGNYEVSRTRLVALARITFGASKEIAPSQRRIIMKEFTAVKPKNEHVKTLLADLLAEEKRQKRIDKFLKRSQVTQRAIAPGVPVNEDWKDFMADIAEEAGYVAADELGYAIASNPEGFVQAAAGCCEGVDLSNVSCPEIDLDCPCPD